MAPSESLGEPCPSSLAAKERNGGRCCGQAGGYHLKMDVGDAGSSAEDYLL